VTPSFAACEQPARARNNLALAVDQDRTLKPKIRMLSAICRICFLLWRRGLAGSGVSWSIAPVDDQHLGRKAGRLAAQGRRLIIERLHFAIGLGREPDKRRAGCIQATNLGGRAEPCRRGIGKQGVELAFGGAWVERTL